MVFRTIAKMTLRPTPQMHFGLPGLNASSLKHYLSVLPLHFFTLGGAIVCGLYCFKLARYQDTRFFKKDSLATDVKPNEKVALFVSNNRVGDLKQRKAPENRPDVDYVKETEE